MKINVRNKKTYKGKGEYIGRPSPLGNPFKINKTIDRSTSISMYTRYITDAIMNEGFASEHHEEIINELNRLFSLLVRHRTLTLICFCSPKLCHGDIIKQLLLNKYYTGEYIIT